MSVSLVMTSGARAKLVVIPFYFSIVIIINREIHSVGMHIYK